MPQNSRSSRAPSPSAEGFSADIAGRGGRDTPVLVTVLDDWLAQALGLMSADARDAAAAPINFALFGLRRQHAIAGHIRPPLLMKRRIDVPEPATFIPDAPLALSGLWHGFEQLGAAEASAFLRNTARHAADMDTRTNPFAAGFLAFLEQHNIGDLDALLARSGFDGALGQVMVALGLLLQPVMRKLPSRLDNSLVLPLPSDPLYRNVVATFWMHLITPFLHRADFELALFITRIDRKPAMVLGFSGASPQTLCAIMDPQAGSARHITFDRLNPVDERVFSDHAIKQLSIQLSQPALPLKTALASFYAAFFAH